MLIIDINVQLSLIRCEPPAGPWHSTSPHHPIFDSSQTRSCHGLLPFQLISISILALPFCFLPSIFTLVASALTYLNKILTNNLNQSKIKGIKLYPSKANLLPSGLNSIQFFGVVPQRLLMLSYLLYILILYILFYTI